MFVIIRLAWGSHFQPTVDHVLLIIIQSTLLNLFIEQLMQAQDT